MNRELFTIWFHETFVSYVKTFTTDPVLLIVDNCSAHLKLTYENITVEFLPPNVTSTNQPLDQGIISLVKRKYRTLVLEGIVSNIDLFQKMTKRKRKQSGLSIGGLPDLMDASIMLKKSWDDISSSTIAKCWLRANIAFPITNVNMGDEVCQKSPETTSNEKIDELSDILAGFALNSKYEMNQIKKIKLKKKILQIGLKLNLMVLKLVKKSIQF